MSCQSVSKWGQGVVGHYPELGPGDCFMYISSVSVSDNQGAIEGALLIEDLQTTDTFEATVNKCHYYAMINGKLHHNEQIQQ